MKIAVPALPSSGIASDSSIRSTIFPTKYHFARVIENGSVVTSRNDLQAAVCNTRDYLKGSKVFEPEGIGRAKYNTATAAVSRAVLRLQSRGLARCMQGDISHWSGINLTPAGIT